MIDLTLNNVLYLFDSSGKSDTDLEKEIGIPRSTIYDWRKDRSKSYKNYTNQIASYFNVSLDWLAGNDQKNKPAAKSDELDPLDIKIIELLNALNPDNKRIAFAQIETLLKLQENQ